MTTRGLPLLLTWALLLGVTSGQFTPGCSFSDGHCLYNVQLGHQGQCDKRAVSSGDCCDAMQSQMTTLTSDVNTLKSQVSTLMSELTNSKNNLSAVTEQLTEAEITTQQLLHTLAQKEAELNTTQSSLAKVIGDAGDEIRTLRAAVDRLTAELNTCRGSLGLATNTHTYIPESSILPDNASLTFCDFEGDKSSAWCGFTNTTHGRGFVLGSGHPNSATGPLEDHTLGSPHGHYAFMDAEAIGQLSSSSSSKTVSMTSQEFPPAPGYCIRLWYNMNGYDVKDFNVYAKIGSGNGYPIVTHHGNVGQDWRLAEADLDSEYTSHPFHLEISATTTAYHSYSGNRYTAGDIAVDDIYVYSTRCKNVPLCPSNGKTRQDGHNTYCYSFHTEPATWYAAASLCRQEGATTSLVTVTSKAEQDFIVQTINGDVALSAAGQFGYFTAGNDERAEHTFDWTDTGTPYHGSYSNWKTGQPNDVGADQDCLLLQYPDLNYQWGDVDCDERHPFICKTVYPTPQGPAAATQASLLG